MTRYPNATAVHREAVYTILDNAVLDGYGGWANEEDAEKVAANILDGEDADIEKLYRGVDRIYSLLEVKEFVEDWRK